MRSGLNRQILGLAIPALGALVAEPLFVLVDSAVVGRLGTTALAGLGIAGGVLTTAVGLCIFLAYATTAATARLVGAGQPARAWRVGIDGCWLAVGLGIVLAILGFATGPALLTGLGAGPNVLPDAVAYLHASLPGLPGMLLVLAATGVLRGFADARTPLIVATIGAVVNGVLNVVLVLGLHLGVAGSGLGTALTQLGMAAALTTVVLRQARPHATTLRPDLAGIRAAGRAGTPLFIRTACLRAVLLMTTAIAARLGATQLAAHQVVMALWSFLALALDALAIAAQTLTGTALGSGDAVQARALTRRMLVWGTGFGCLLAVALAGLHTVLPPLFSSDPDVQQAIAVALLAAAIGQPLSGYVFVLDGVLMGAGDATYLAWASLFTMLGYLPLAWWVLHTGAGLFWLWVAFGIGFLGLRAITLAIRDRSGAWAVTGAAR